MIGLLLMTMMMIVVMVMLLKTMTMTMMVMVMMLINLIIRELGKPLCPPQRDFNSRRTDMRGAEQGGAGKEQ